MIITILQGSPHKNGSSNMLANEFVKGAKEAGHT
ncbi:MAG: flavodoxin family protein, partial [bacterium]|nr:flavodoxin family protein [bacterium]